MKLTHGIIAMLVTPFTADYRLNEPALRTEVQWAIEKGATGVGAAFKKVLTDLQHPEDAAERLLKRLPALNKIIAR